MVGTGGIARPTRRSPAPVGRHARVEPEVVPTAVARWGFPVAAAVVVAWALFQNLYRLGTASILTDEPTYQVSGWTAIQRQTGPALTVADAKAYRANLDVFERPALGKLLFGLPQRLVGHQSVLADRVLVAVATLVLALVVGWWVGRAAGRWTGLLAGAFVALLPAPAAEGSLRMGRYAYADPLASLFMVLSVVAAWEWSRRKGTAVWPWVVATGVAVGVAAGIKENGGFGVIGPVLLLLAWSARDREERVPLVVQAAAAAGTAAVVWLVPYLWFTQPATRIRYLFAYQSEHASKGHLVGYAGKATDRPDWWANLWFAGHGWGTVLTISLVVAVGAAVALRRDAAVAWWSAALAVPLVFHLFVAGVTLPYYWTAWTPAWFVLAALGVDAVVRRLRETTLPVWFALELALLLVAAPVVAAGAESARVARVEPEGVQVLADVRADNQLTGSVLSVGTYLYLYLHYLPGVRVEFGDSPSLEGIDTVVVAAPSCRNTYDLPRGRAILANARADGALRLVHHDDLVRVYRVVEPLRPPTDAEVAAQPPTDLSAGC